MATLRTKFLDSAGKELVVSFPYADPTKSAAVKPLMDGMIAKGAIYANAPMSKKAADYVVTTTTPINIT